MWNKKLYIVQLRRLFGGWMFRISCLVSIILVIAQTWQNHTSIYEAGWPGPVTLYAHWIGNDMGTYAASLFYDLLPLLAMLPFGVQYLMDRQSGYLKNLMTRVPVKAVALSYAVCTAIGAFVASFFPFALSLLVSALQYPALLPECTTLQYGVDSGGFFSVLFYSHPFVYCLVYSGICALFFALLALVGMGLSFYFKNVFLSLMFPFLFDFLFSYLALTVHMAYLAPLYIFTPSPLVDVTPVSILGWYGLCLAVSVCLFAACFKKYELY